MAEIIDKVNDLFKGELTESDKLVYVNDVIKGKLLESEVLMQQAANNTKEQFSNSPDLASSILNAMDAFAWPPRSYIEALREKVKARGKRGTCLVNACRLIALSASFSDTLQTPRGMSCLYLIDSATSNME